MRKLGVNCIIIILCSILSACAIKSQQTIPSANKKNLEYNAVLSDPVIKKDFRNLRKAAMSARVYNQDGNVYLVDQDIKKLNELSAILIDRLHYHYHLDPNKYNIRTFISRNKQNSCYQYYNSIDTSIIGKSCNAFPEKFATCQLCNEYIQAVKGHGMRIIHAHWWENKRITALTNTFRLKNGDDVYLGLELTSID